MEHSNGSEIAARLRALAARFDQVGELAPVWVSIDLQVVNLSDSPDYADRAATVDRLAAALGLRTPHTATGHYRTGDSTLDGLDVGAYTSGAPDDDDDQADDELDELAADDRAERDYSDGFGNAYRGSTEVQA